jgi:hypothetical protein
MATRTPLAALIETRMQQLALDRAAWSPFGISKPSKGGWPCVRFVRWSYHQHKK